MIDSLPRPGAIRSRSEQRGPDRKKSQVMNNVKYEPRHEKTGLGFWTRSDMNAVTEES